MPVGIVLRRIDVEAHAVIKREIAFNFPRVLEIEFRVGEQESAARPRGTFGVGVVVAKKRVSVCVIRIERVVAVGLEVERSANLRTRVLDFQGVLEVEANFVSVGPRYFTHVVDDAVNRVLIDVREIIIHRRIGRVGDSAEGHVRDYVQRVQRGVALRNVDAEFGAVDHRYVERIEGQRILAEGDREIVEHGCADVVGGMECPQLSGLLEDDRRQREVEGPIDPDAIKRILLI